MSHLLLIRLSQETGRFLFPLFVLSMPSLHLTNLVISLCFCFVFLPLTPKCFTPYWLVRYLVFDCKIIYCRIKNYKLTQEEETVSSQVI